MSTATLPLNPAMPVEPRPRVASPRVTCSILITSAPQSARMPDAAGTKVCSATSRMRMPSITFAHGGAAYASTSTGSLGSTTARAIGCFPVLKKQLSGSERGTMRAALFNGTSTLEIDEIDVADPAPGQVRVRVHHCGICHSDYTVLAGGLGHSPQVLGHEASGIVDAIGDGVELLAVGDKVVLTPIASCGRCYWCTRGAAVAVRQQGPDVLGRVPRRHHRPLARREVVYRGMGVGGFAEYALVSETGAIKIPADTPLDVACVIGCAVQTGAGAVLNTAKVEPGATVLVLGLGGIGLSVVQGAHVAGAARIIGSDPIADRRKMAQHLGATDVIDPATSDVVATVQELTGGIGVDYAFEAAGVIALQSVAIDATRAGGSTVLVGAPLVRGIAHHPEHAHVGDAGEEAPRLLHGQHATRCATSRRSWRCGAPGSSISSRSSPRADRSTRSTTASPISPPASACAPSSTSRHRPRRRNR